MNKEREISCLDILANVASDEIKRINYKENTEDYNKINQIISSSIKNELMDIYERETKKGYTNYDIIYQNMNMVDKVLISAFVNPAVYVKKDMTSIVNSPKVTYTNNKLVNNILDKAFVMPVEYNRYN